LYYLKITYRDSVYYKIGITNRTINERFKVRELEKIEVIKTWEFGKGYEAFEKEQQILKQYDKFRYKGKERILESNGNSELFIKDILPEIENIINCKDNHD